MTCSPRTVLTLETVDEILWYHHSNNASSVVLSYGTNYLVSSPNFWGCGWNLMVLPIPITPFWQYFHIVLHNYLVCGSKLLSPWKKSCIQKTSFLCHGWYHLYFDISPETCPILWHGHRSCFVFVFFFHFFRLVFLSITFVIIYMFFFYIFYLRREQVK